MNFRIYFISFIIFLSNCSLPLKINSNSKEGFVDKNASFFDYANTSKEYGPLKGVLLKVEKIKFLKSYEDSINQNKVIWHSYAVYVNIKIIDKWGPTGLSSNKLSKYNLKFEISINRKNSTDIYNEQLKKTIRYVQNKKNINNYESSSLGGFKTSDGAFLYQDDEDTEDSFILFGNELTIVFKTSGKKKKKLYPGLLAFISYDLTRGIAIIQSGKLIEFDSKNLLSLEELLGLK